MSLLRSKVRSDLNKTRRFAVVRRRFLHEKRRRRLATPLLQVLEPRHLLAFSTELFADINQFGVSSLPDSFIEFNSQVFFVANDGLSGSELWKSDGLRFSRFASTPSFKISATCEFSPAG